MAGGTIVIVFVEGGGRIGSTNSAVGTVGWHNLASQGGANSLCFPSMFGLLFANLLISAR